ncbi:MAG: hypothetical protein DI551_00595 [Micavibrio aeruginosavorus]|uniref:Uncharacterized protein n=1 Tax=Micavibrio aeruginosavorus TaxID=349221 RepID=A0A2W5N5W3_9BACT|nr:MAG: hypothetical protein DI551_00595 [Micavibrio aeruginosavorus]
MAIAVAVPDRMKKKFEPKPIDASMRRGWSTPYGFVDFTTPVSYEEAVRVAKIVADRTQKQ